MVRTPAGLSIPASIAAPDKTDLDRVFTKVATGLYFWKTGDLPGSDTFEVRLMSSSDFDQWSRLLAQPVQRLGSEFWWMTGMDPEEDTWAIWLFMVFGAVPIGVWYGKATDLWPLPGPAGIVLRPDGWDG